MIYYDRNKETWFDSEDALFEIMMEPFEERVWPTFENTVDFWNWCDEENIVYEDLL